MPVVTFKKPDDPNDEPVKKKRVRKTKAVEPVATPEPVVVEEPIKKKRVRKTKVVEPVATHEPVEESTPEPVSPTKEKKAPSKWQLHVKKTFEENKGKPFKDVMAISKESYSK